MDPKFLADRFEELEKAKSDAAAAGHAKAAADKAQAIKDAEDIEHAIINVAIPYLDKVKAAMNGNFSYSAQRDVQTLKPIFLRLQLRNRGDVVIRHQGRVLSVTREFPDRPGSAAVNSLRTAIDVTEANLGDLIRRMMEDRWI